jgi:hypothetical protein
VAITEDSLYSYVLPRYVTEGEIVLESEAPEETVEVGREKGLSDDGQVNHPHFCSPQSKMHQGGARGLLHCERPPPISAIPLGLAKSQQSVKTSFGKVVCELKAAELDFPSSGPKTGLYRQ